MTLTKKRSIQQIFLMERGLGPDVMRLTKVCPSCGRGNNVANDRCVDCGEELGSKTLLDLYLSRHTCCPHCGIAVTRTAIYCPSCGTRVKLGKAAVV